MVKTTTLSLATTAKQASPQATGLAAQTTASTQTNTGLINVDKDNFQLNGNATYDAGTGTVTLTKDQTNQVGNFTLDNKIDMDSAFTLTGQVNLGSNPNGADGIGFAFHDGNTNAVGNSGGNLGIGGLQNATGFKLDTWHNNQQNPTSDLPADQVPAANSEAYGWPADSKAAPYGSFVKTTQTTEIVVKETGDGSFAPTRDTVDRWWAHDVTSSAQSLNRNDINGNFHDFTIKYDGQSRKLTVTYKQTDGTTLTWTTTIDPGQTSLAFEVGASTGNVTNLQQFKISAFDYTAAATVDVQYVDSHGSQLGTGTATYSDGPYVGSTYTTEQKSFDGYSFVGVKAGTAANGTLTKAGNNGTVVYEYVKNSESQSASTSTSASMSDSASQSNSTSVYPPESESTSTSTSTSSSDSHHEGSTSDEGSLLPDMDADQLVVPAENPQVEVSQSGVKTVNSPTTSSTKLPQTGEQNSKQLIVGGIILTALSAALAWVLRRNKKNN